MNLNKCIICNNNIESFDINLNICGLDDCEYKSRTIFTNDEYVCNYIHQNMDEALFILTLTKNAINDTILYTPIPIYNDINEKETLLNLREIFKEINIEKELKDILGMNEQEIYNHIGPIKYGLFKFTLKSNLIDIKKINMFKTLQTYKIIHDQYDITIFNQKVKEFGSSYLFHGSNINNWYSILMNGLKIFSKTKRMANGNSYGDGIYLSNDFNLSYGYSTRNQSTFIVGVFEIIGDINKYKKTNTIYVVNDITVLRLKYILYGKECKEFKQISDKFNTQIVNEQKEEKKYYNKMSNKRLMIEYNNILKTNLESFGLRFEINENNILEWKVYINKIDDKSNLYKDMKELKIENIEMEIRFNSQYPILPPFVRIIKPIFQFQTGHITSGGSICMELLTNQGWSPAYSIENLLIHIKATILEGEGRLDKTKKNTEYKYEESKKAFQRMLITHGWK